MPTFERSERGFTAPVSSLPASLWRGRIPGLDGLRALSILLVFASHLGFMGGRPGGFGVIVFFLLSGYLIASLLVREYQKTGTISLTQFYFRRTLRIFPSMYATLIACIVLTYFHVFASPVRAGVALLEAAYLQNYTRWWMMVQGLPGSYVPGTGQFWSLCIEEHFYLLFPVLLLFLLRRSMSFPAISAVLFGLCMVVLAWRLVVAHTFPVARWYCYMATDTRLDSILWGCLLTTAENHAPWRERLTYRRVAAVVPFCLGALALTFLFHDAGQITYNYTVQGIALMPVLYMVTHYPTQIFTRPLNHPVLVHIGTLSYAIYLVHSAVIEIVRRYVHDARWSVWPLCALLSYLAALGLHWIVEKPFLAWRDRHKARRQDLAPQFWSEAEPLKLSTDV